ncbi:MAG: hypothetical protein AAFP70_08280, partial [Calditrichota bacterium]
MTNDLNRQMDIRMNNSTFLRSLVLLLMISCLALAQEQKRPLKSMNKQERAKAVKKEIETQNKFLQDDDRHDRLKETIINGNQITVLLTNQ